MKKSVTFCNGKVTRDPQTGRFVSIADKPMHIKEAAKPRAKKAKAAPAETPAEPEVPALEILSALYGIDGNRVEMATVKVGRKLTNKMAGSDPAPKTPKNAIIRVRVAGEEVEKTFNEGETIEF